MSHKVKIFITLPFTKIWLTVDIKENIAEPLYDLERGDGFWFFFFFAFGGLNPGLVHACQVLYH
jgi:hypothetical protein